LLLVAFLLVNAPKCHLSLLVASVVQGDAVNCNTTHEITYYEHAMTLVWFGSNSLISSSSAHADAATNLKLLWKSAFVRTEYRIHNVQELLGLKNFEKA